MGLFSKLFGNAIDEKTVKGVFDDLSKAVNGPGGNKQSEQTNYYAPAAAAPEISDEKPAEENQYNFKGTYIQYFDKVFREEFPEYEISYERSSLNRTSTIFTFRSSGNTPLSRASISCSAATISVPTASCPLYAAGKKAVHRRRSSKRSGAPETTA